ncbi:MAG TPA: hypothetical protein GX702_04040 [Chloroflexi bacterium]|jgi:ribosome-associated translation inhibitor RaiA|nr:hypothetical protein [Chloroflexota bacterium]
MDEPFDFEFHTDEESLREDLRADAEMALRGLAEEYSGITGAAVSVERMTRATVPHRFRARIVLYMQPSNMVAVEKDDTAAGALRKALQAIERQVSERREKLVERWQQP